MPLQLQRSGERIVALPDRNFRVAHIGHKGGVVRHRFAEPGKSAAATSSPTLSLPESADPVQKGEGIVFEVFVLGFGQGVRLRANTSEKMLETVARRGLERTMINLPAAAYREIVEDETGYYCHVLVPLPNDLPDRIPIL